MTLRVTFLVNRMNVSTGGGSHHSLHLTATGMCRLGHDVRVVVLDAATSSGLENAPYRVSVEGGWRRAARFDRLRAVADILRRYERESDVFHVYSPEWAPSAGQYRSTGHLPTLVTLNGYTIWCTNSDRINGQCYRSCGLVQRLRHAPTAPMRKLLSVPTRTLEQFVALPWVQHVDHFLPVSPAVRRVHEEAGFDLSRNTVVPDVIDFHAIRAAAGRSRADRPARAGVTHVLYAGRLTPAKGVDVLIDAIPRVTIPVHLHVAGDGPERSILELRAEQLGIADRVTFHGWVPNRELWELLQGVDIFVHPGRWPEPGGRSVLEALTLGIPTIVSYTGGPPWLVGTCGRTFTPGDAADLAIEIDRLCQNYGRALEAAERGIERAAEFDFQRWVPKLAEIYRTVKETRCPEDDRAEAVTGSGRARR
jgi:starch synthase